MTSNLTRAERILARHILQELMERIRLLRNAVEPETGMLAVSRERFAAEIDEITRQLGNLKNDKKSHRSLPGTQVLRNRLRHRCSR